MEKAPKICFSHSELAISKAFKECRGRVSLSGLQALLIARGSAQSHLKMLLKSTSPITFMGTPHMGSAKAEVARILAQLTNVLRKTNKNILSLLKPSSEVLANIQQESHTILNDRSRN